MPIYAYQASSESNSCVACISGFEVIQKMRDERLQTCPACGAQVRRVITAPHLTTGTPSLDERNIENHGFTQYRKSEKGVYEKTAGKGPDFIKGEDS
jgi:putative FmdB family regulatory protein